MDPTASQTNADVGPTMRLAVIGSPRSGNTWLRGLLSSLFALEELAAHRPEDLDWTTLPHRCVLQIHSTREPGFLALLQRHEFQVVVPARHPLDVLISALNYEQYIADNTVWHADDGTVRSLRGASPQSTEFLEYATSNHPGSILTISPDWWDQPGVHRVRYEDLVRDTAGTLALLADSLGAEFHRPIAEVVPKFTIEAQRARYDVWHYHFWHGRPNLWRALLPTNLVRQIYEAHRSVFETLGYTCVPDERLRDEDAAARWHEMQHQSLQTHLANEQSKHAKTRADLIATRDHLERVHGILYNERLIFAATEQALAEAQAQIARLTANLEREPNSAPPSGARARRTAVHRAHARLFTRPRVLTRRLLQIWLGQSRGTSF